MIKRKKKLIDRNFQLKIYFNVIGLSTLSFLIVLAFVGVMAMENDRRISGMIDHLTKAVETEENIIKAFVDFSGEITGKNVRLNVTNIFSDHEKSIATIKGYINYIKSSAREYKKIILVILAVVVLQLFLFYVFLIRFTHRISGPLYVMERYVQALVDGKKPIDRDLREGDELKNLYEKLRLLSAKLEGKKKRKPAVKKK